MSPATPLWKRLIGQVSYRTIQSYSRKDESCDFLMSWAKKWSESKIGWHKKEPHQYLVKYDKEIIPGSTTTVTAGDYPEGREQLRVFVPLCGKTIDMKYLAEHEGVSEVVGIDGIRKALEEFVEEHPSLELKETEGIKAVEKFQGNKVVLMKGDLFGIDETMTGGTFDVILDRASIVAIHPSLRNEYIDLMGKLLKPGGSILLITNDRRSGTEEGKKNGPPFSINDNDIKRLYDVEWVESITKLDEHNEFEDEATKARWAMEEVDSLFELCYLIKAKKQCQSNL